MTSPSQKPVVQPPKRHWVRYTVSFLLLILVIAGISRACTGTGVISNFRPFFIAQQRISSADYIAGKERNIEAFINELIQIIAKEQGLRVQVSIVSSGLGFIGLENGDYDAIITTLIPNATNQRNYKFSDPLYRVGAVLIVRTDSKYRSLKEIEGKVIGITREESTFFDVGTYPDLVFYSYDDDIDALDDLERKQIDGVIMNAWQAYSLTQSLFKGKLKVATEPFTKEGFRLATLKDARFSEQLSSFDQGLEKVKQDGRFNDLLNKWELVDTEIGHESQRETSQ